MTVDKTCFVHNKKTVLKDSFSSFNIYLEVIRNNFINDILEFFKNVKYTAANNFNSQNCKLG